MQSREIKITRKIQLGTSAESEAAAAMGRTAFTMRQEVERARRDATTHAAQVPPISAPIRLPLTCHTIMITDAAPS
jgi:hypothetical protein